MNCTKMDITASVYRLSRKIRKSIPYVLTGAICFATGSFVGHYYQAKQNQPFYTAPIQVPGLDLPLERIVTKNDFCREFKFDPKKTLVKFGNYRISLPVALACVDGKMPDLIALARKGIGGISKETKDGREYLVIIPAKAAASAPKVAAASDDDEEE